MKNPLMKEFLEKFRPKKFKPLAYFDKKLNTIVILIRDCSFAEKSFNPNISVLVDNLKGNYIGLYLRGYDKKKTINQILDKILEKSVLSRDLKKFISRLKKYGFVLRN